MMFLTGVLLLVAALLRLVSGADWCYQSQDVCCHTCTEGYQLFDPHACYIPLTSLTGPEVWASVSWHCSGRHQSSVNIVTKKTLPDERLTPFHFVGYEEAFHGRLVNSGHTVYMDLPSSMKIEGGNLVQPYKAVQAHLHWGKGGGPGSEHTIDGEQFSMEMHIVHIKEEYTSVSQAFRDPAGVAVLGFFFQESESSNRKFDLLINSLRKITRPSNSTTLTGVSLELFLPPQRNMTKYYRYHGLLTTPSCAEAVIWSLFEDPIPLSRKQLAAFSQLQFSNGRQMVQTYRPLQPLNGRQVLFSTGSVTAVSTVLIIMSVVVSTAVSVHAAG